MTSEQLRIFLAVVTEGTEKDAAVNLFMSQSAVSKQIRGLEEQIGVSLFHRSSKGKRLLLSVAGQVLYEYAKELLAKEEIIIDEVKQLAQQGYDTHIKIGAIRSAIYWVAPIISRFQLLHERCRLTIRFGDSSFLLQQLVANKLDMIIAMAPLRTAGLEQKTLFLEQLVAVVAPTHPLAMKGSVHPQELSSYRLILPLPETSFRSLLHTFLYSFGVIATAIILEVESSETAIKVTSHGVGVAFLLRSSVSVAIEKQELIQIEILPSLPLVQFILAHRKLSSSASLLQELIESFDNFICKINDNKIATIQAPCN